MNADKFVVRGQTYDVLSPATFGDYIETVGAACINPLGYDENKLFLAYDDNVQKLFRATTAIAYSELLIKDTNCEPTTMAEALANALSAGGVSYDNTDSGLTASNVQDAIDEVNGNVETVNNDLANIDTVISENGAKNLLPNTATSQVINGVTFTVNADGTITASGTASAQINFLVGYVTLEPESYKISGSNGGTSTTAWVHVNEGWNDAVDYDADVKEITTTTTYGVYIVVRSGIQVNKTFKPMITLASQPNSDYAHYVPYAKTNRELTTNISGMKWKVVDGVTTSASGNVLLTSYKDEGYTTINAFPDSTAAQGTLFSSYTLYQHAELLRILDSSLQPLANETIRLILVEVKGI